MQAKSFTHAGIDSRVAALVYIAALGPDETETSQGQQGKFPKTDVLGMLPRLACGHSESGD